LPRLVFHGGSLSEDLSLAVLVTLTPEALWCPGYHAGPYPANEGCCYCESPSYLEGLTYRKAAEFGSERRIASCSSPAPENTTWLSLVGTAGIQGFPEVSTSCHKYWIPCSRDVSLHKWIQVIPL